MIENKIEQLQTAVLIAVDTGEYDVEISLDELEELAKTAGAQVLARVTQKRPGFDPATCIGGGRLEEAAEFCKNNNVDLVIFDHELTAGQIRNIEKIVDRAVIDRTMLILDIFAQRAVTSEGKLQVELAQLRYRLPRLMGMGGALSRLGGGIGTRGPGETKLESDRRHIRRRISALQDQLEQLEKRRGLLRARRKKDGVTTVAIVGYTNVGKSTLLNTLTDAGVLAQDKLFATLDPTSRALQLPDGRSVMLVDTVGFVRRLPHHLVEAFKSTLEEAVSAESFYGAYAIFPPTKLERADRRYPQTDAGTGSTGYPHADRLNKCDRVSEAPLAISDSTAIISAKTGFGIDALLHKTAKALTPSQHRLSLLIPYEKTRADQ